jgi:hypothetical protein
MLLGARCFISHSRPSLTTESAGLAPPKRLREGDAGGEGGGEVGFYFFSATAFWVTSGFLQTV